jgi:chemotaxis protein methyltransferase CheR
MNAPIPERLISDLSDYVGSRIGMSFPPERWQELTDKVTRAAGLLGFSSPASCIEWLLSSPADKKKLDAISGCLTVGETFFFRDAPTLRALAELAFPEIVRAHAGGARQLRIWSAGCSTGEEPYTVAMMVREYPGFRGWNVNILGTDINPAALEKAEAGVFSEWAFRGVDPGIKQKFFHQREGARYEILPELRGMVDFSHLNLVEDVYPVLFNETNAMDLVLCRNVLMYLGAAQARAVGLRLHRCLRPQGWLTVSPVEAPLVPRPEFAPVFHAGGILCRKALERTAVSVIVPPAPKRARARRPPVRVLKPVRQTRPAATYTAALQLYGCAEYAAAVEILQGLAEMPRAGTEVFLLLSRAYANSGMLPQAERWCARAIAADALRAGSRYLLGLILIEQKRSAEAVSTLRKAIYLEPDFVMAHVALANVFHRERKPALSARHIGNARKALRGFPPEMELPDAEGMTAGKLTEMISGAREDGGNG